jgi:GNAT superfamily N-acetyltransferase
MVASVFRAVVEPFSIYSAEARQAELQKYDAHGLRALIINKKAYVGLALIDDDPVGFSIAEPDGDLWWFAWFGVLPRARGHRLGCRLVENVIDTARQRGLRKVWCDLCHPRGIGTNARFGSGLPHLDHEGR